MFSLPFHVARFFRPTFLDVFGVSNTELGDIFALYGVIAMLAYFPGGALADRFSVRKLLTISLIATAAGGLFMAQIPTPFGLAMLFAYWGLTSIFMFWASLIKATREWGGSLSQGRAFGFLEGGRGLVAAAVASLAVAVITFSLPVDLNEANNIQRRATMQYVIYLYTSMTFFAALLVWLFVPEVKQYQSYPINKYALNIKKLLQSPVVWLQAIVVICAYCGYKGLDNYGLYMVDVLSMSEYESAQFMALAAYLRPVAAIAAGLIVDKMFASRIINWIFVLSAASYLFVSVLNPDSRLIWALYGNVIFSFAAIFALRGVYFALLEETGTAHQSTGITVGLISLVGFTPDIFFASIAGRILDSAEGITAYRMYFWFLLIFAIAGFVASLLLMRTRKSHYM